jgi:hypothetical protein
VVQAIAVVFDCAQAQKKYALPLLVEHIYWRCIESGGLLSVGLIRHVLARATDQRRDGFRCVAESLIR